MSPSLSFFLFLFVLFAPLLIAQPPSPSQPSSPHSSYSPPPPPSPKQASPSSPKQASPSLSCPPLTPPKQASPSSSHPPPPPTKQASSSSSYPPPPPPPPSKQASPSSSHPPPLKQASPSSSHPPSPSKQASPSSSDPPPPPPPSPPEASPSSSYPPPPPPPPSSSSACKSTIYPKLCRSILSAIRSSPSDPYHLGKFSIKKSRKQAMKLAKVFDDFLKKHRSSSLNGAEVAALIDCSELNKLNADYLESVSSELKSAEASSPELLEDIETYLSAVATNHYTCYDGLVAAKSGIASALKAPLKNMTQLYSVSLGLISEALHRNLKKQKVQKRGLPTKSSKVRQPLEKLVKLLREKYGCEKSSSSCRRSERILAESEERGILLNDFVIVNTYGTGNFCSIGDAIDAAPKNTKPQDGYFLVYVEEGVYEEYVVVPKYKRNILLVGDGINRTVITGNHSVVDGWTTFNSSTFAVSGDRFTAVDITFRNTAGPHKHQAVALRNNADLSAFYRCSFEGYQDTLYVHSLRQFYRDCDIYGTVDFIFGNAAAVLQHCNIYARNPMPGQKNAVTAQGRTDPNQNTGISIQNCTVSATPDLTGSGSTLTYLGRPWKEYSRTVFMESYIGDVIQPSGWLEWNGTLGLDTLFYGEFNNQGPGSDTSRRVQWGGYKLLSAEEAFNFTVLKFTLGETWLPDTDIPFFEGL